MWVIRGGQDFDDLAGNQDLVERVHAFEDVDAE